MSWGTWSDGSAFDAAGQHVGRVRVNRTLRLCQLILGDRFTHAQSPRVGDRVQLSHADTNRTEDCLVISIEPPLTRGVVVFAYE
jgi:hypothetical protein